jgi:hypothetical protein
VAVNEGTEASADDGTGPDDRDGTDAGGTDPDGTDADVERRVLEALPNADGEEAAAIAAAISSHLRAEERAAAAGEADRGWAEPGRRWAFTGRARRTGGRRVRVPDDAPTDFWAAAGRTDRMD